MNTLIINRNRATAPSSRGHRLAVKPTGLGLPDGRRRSRHGWAGGRRSVRALADSPLCHLTHLYSVVASSAIAVRFDVVKLGAI